MVAMGLVGDATEFGLEGTGRVRRVGEHVTNLEPGNEVVVVTGGVMRNRVVVDQKRCGRLDQEHAHLDLEGAATMPTVFATALWVFVHLARLCKGQVRRRRSTDCYLVDAFKQTVLIHSGCGGVGLASIRVCQQLGAKVPGNPPQLDLLLADTQAL
jgi:NADPH:quinone reductase-like Zn-dependent oxidoreductase